MVTSKKVQLLHRISYQFSCVFRCSAVFLCSSMLCGVLRVFSPVFLSVAFRCQSNWFSNLGIQCESPKPTHQPPTPEVMTQSHQLQGTDEGQGSPSPRKERRRCSSVSKDTRDDHFCVWFPACPPLAHPSLTIIFFCFYIIVIHIFI